MTWTPCVNLDAPNQLTTPHFAEIKAGIFVNPHYVRAIDGLASANASVAVVHIGEPQPLRIYGTTAADIVAQLTGAT